MVAPMNQHIVPVEEVEEIHPWRHGIRHPWMRPENHEIMMRFIIYKPNDFPEIIGNVDLNCFFYYLQHISPIRLAYAETSVGRFMLYTLLQKHMSEMDSAELTRILHYKAVCKILNEFALTGLVPNQIRNVTSADSNYITFGQFNYLIAIPRSFMQCLRRGSGGRLLGSVVILEYTYETSKSAYLHKYKESNGWITEEFDHVGEVDILTINEEELASSLPQE